ncbi:hypothetical protein PSQ19_01510 [Devosia algicola]|uniref:AprE-like long alpha-helical hairpin domain-containing protein n=1 Tax=Devosia algicola TaxID=3026418 RepID=A0ABY7YNP4_9HYPH|nr:hypothetical protein [Devosia algicola]WDR02930.1 hypothetical protein PSQ19_01510 [Devosia algicola]
MADQQTLRQSRRRALENEVSRFKQLIDEKRSVIDGYEAQLTAYNGQMKLVQEEIAQQAALFEKNLAQISGLTSKGAARPNFPARS